MAQQLARTPVRAPFQPGLQLPNIPRQPGVAARHGGDAGLPGNDIIARQHNGVRFVLALGDILPGPLVHGQPQQGGKQEPRRDRLVLGQPEIRVAQRVDQKSVGESSLLLRQGLLRLRKQLAEQLVMTQLFESLQRATAEKHLQTFLKQPRRRDAA